MVKNRIHILLIFLLFVIYGSQAQEKDSYVYRQIVKIAYLNRDGKFNEAYHLSNSLISHLKKINAPDSSYANPYFFKGSIEISLGKYREAIKSTRESLKLFSKNKDSLEMASSLNQIGVGYYYLSDYDSTKIYYEKSYLIKKKLKANNNELAVSAYNLAMVYEDLEESEKALELYKKAKEYLLLDQNGLSFLPDVYVGIAHIYYQNKDIDTAERYIEKAMDVGLKMYGEFNPNMTFIYNLYSNILKSKKEYKQAIEMIQKSLKIRENTYGKNHVWTCDSYYVTGRIYLLNKQYDKAEDYLKTAADIAKKIKNFQYLANVQTKLAELYIIQNIHPVETEKLLDNALDLRKRIFGEKNDVISETYYLMARNNFNRNNRDLFFKHIHKVYTSANYDRNNLFRIIAPFHVINAMALESNWYQKEYEKNNDLNMVFKKFELIDPQIELINYAEQNFSSSKSKIAFANDYRTIFEKGLNTCWQLYNKNGEYQYLQKAFELSETNRNTVLLSGLQDNKYKLYANIPEELLSYEKNIEKTLSKVKTDLYYEKKSPNPDKKLLSELIEKRIRLYKDLDSLHTIFILDYSKYKNLKYNRKKIDIKDVQKELDKNSQLIIYFLDDQNLYTFSITSEAVRFKRIEAGKSIESGIDQLKKGLLNRKNITGISKSLYHFLLKDFLDKNKNSLIIVPDNILSYIPFEILINDQKKYITEQYEVSYSGSTRLFLELKDNFFNYSLPKNWVGYSPFYKEERQLKAANLEVNTIKEITGGEVFIGKEATKSSFLDHSKEFNIMHFAMHALIDNENPMFNKLEFYDGELTSSEISVTDIKSNLVVLSACNTGFGKLEKAEGVMSLARSFHFSGVPAIIMSLWKVPDKETGKLMLYFYEYLKKGYPKSAALQKAKLKYLENTKDEVLKHPYYWSGFVLNGNTSALYQSNDKIYFYLLTVLFTSGLFFFLYKKYF